MSNQHDFQNQPRPRPLWQLLLVAQTNFLPALTCAENRALLDFLIQLVAEGYDVERIEGGIAHCLMNSRGCD